MTQATPIGYAAGGVAGAGAATNQIYNNDYVDFQTGKVIRAKCAAGTTNAAGLPCVAGVVNPGLSIAIVSASIHNASVFGIVWTDAN